MIFYAHRCWRAIAGTAPQPATVVVFNTNPCSGCAKSWEIGDAHDALERTARAPPEAAARGSKAAAARLAERNQVVHRLLPLILGERYCRRAEIHVAQHAEALCIALCAAIAARFPDAVAAAKVAAPQYGSRYSYFLVRRAACPFGSEG